MTTDDARADGRAEGAGRAREGAAGDDASRAASAGAAGALPGFFLAALAAQYGPDDVERVVRGCRVRRVTSLRANALRSTPEAVAAQLDAAGIAWRHPAWSDAAFELPDAREAQVRALPAYAAGELYLQSLSSQLPAILMAPRAGEDVLDMCAAPGGKTSQIAALTGGAARVTACEMHGPRAERLAHNLALLGVTGVNLMRVDARWLDDFFSFDRILLDAPCTGSGTLRADDPRMPARFTERLLAKCRASQRALLRKALRLLKPGATMVYSTCSVLRAENEDVIREALGAGGCALVPLDVDGLAAKGVPVLPASLPGALCVCPTASYEGFFVARLRRTA